LATFSASDSVRAEWPVRAASSVVTGSPVARWLPLSLAGCESAPSGQAPSGSASSEIDVLCADDVGVACENGPGSILVTVSTTATDEETIDLARRLHAAAAAASLDAGARLQRESADGPVLDTEFAAPAPWQLAVNPRDAEQIDTVLREIVAVAAVPGTLGIGVYNGWPSAPSPTSSSSTVRRGVVDAALRTRRHVHTAVARRAAASGARSRSDDG
jgi:hypothetical protein